jgi:hypothetical protein
VLVASWLRGHERLHHVSGDIDSEFPSGDSRAGSSTTDLEPLTPAPEETVAAEDLDTDWAVHDESTLSGRFAWIFSSGEELSGPATANSVTLGVLLAGLYHPRVSVVSACLKQLGSLIKQGWFRKGTCSVRVNSQSTSLMVVRGCLRQLGEAWWHGV